MISGIFQIPLISYYVALTLDSFTVFQDNEGQFHIMVRDGLTGQVLVAENVISSETTVMKRPLAPVAVLKVPVLDTITDAEVCELMMVVEQLWHQVCQLHAPRNASKQAYEQDRKVKTAMRKQLRPKVKTVRKQLHDLMREAESADELCWVAVTPTQPLP